MSRIDKVLQELDDLRESRVRIFGLPHTYKGYDECEIEVSTVEFLESVREKEIILEDINQEYGTDFQSHKEFLDYLHHLGEIDLEDNRYLHSDNTYNYGGHFTNEMVWHGIQMVHEDYYIVQLAVHRYGDVRSNYTDYIYLLFDCEYDFFDALSVHRNLVVEVEGQDFLLIFSGIDSDIDIINLDTDEDWGYGYGDLQCVISDIEEGLARERGEID